MHLIKYLWLILILGLAVTNPAFAYSDVSEIGASDFATGQATVTTTATQVLTPVNAYPNQKGWIIRNMDTANPIYIGKDATDSSSTGFIIKAGESMTICTQRAIWMISTGGSVQICWFAPLTGK